MTNLFLRSKGAATLLITLVLIILSTLIILFAANYGMMQQKISANYNRNNQAYYAAEAGLEYGLAYLKQNRNTVIATASGGLINYSTAAITNVTLNNNAKFSVTYTNPVSSDYTLIKITSTGQNSDNSATRIISQIVKYQSLAANTGTTGVTSKGNVNLSGNSAVINTNNNSTITAGGTVSFSGNSNTQTAGGLASWPGHILSDVTASANNLSSMSVNDYIANYFGTSSTSALQASFNNVYSSSTSRDYSSSLNGANGTAIWINQTGGVASISGNTVIGTATNPVLLVVNGNFSVTGNVTIYGFVFIISSSGLNTLTGNISVIGGIATTDELNMQGNSDVTFSPTVLNNLKNNSNIAYWAKVGGSWKDF